MTVCRFFQQGNCRYGNNCRFEHVNPYKYNNYPSQAASSNASSGACSNVTTEQLINQVATDVNGVVEGRQWLFSSYGPFKFKPNFPGLVDVSPEEVRYRAYEARSSGDFSQLKTQMSIMEAEVMGKLKALSKPTPAIIEAIEAVYKNIVPRDPFAASSANFGQYISNAVENQNVFNIFGGNMQSSDSTASNIFAQAANELFQNSSMDTISTQSGLFNNNNLSAQIPPTGGNIFGVTKQSTFLNNEDTTANFNNHNSVQNIFSSQQNVNVFSQPSNSTPNNLFANANQNIFEKPSGVNHSINPFGVAQNNYSNVTSNIFGNQLTSSNIFSNSSTTTNIYNNTNTFGDNADVIDQNIYSKMEDLTEEEEIAFKSNSFKRGKIPETAPPKELCM